MRGLLDTSVFIAAERDRPLARDQLPDEAAISVVTVEQVASALAELVAVARRTGVRPKIQDTWIAATARAHRVALYTQDADFDGISGIEVVRV